jgi:hypothetical protein
MFFSKNRQKSRFFGLFLPVFVKDGLAEKIILVLDNLNTHSLASLYEAFPAEEALRLAKRLEIHHPLKHGSWLNMVEIELSALKGQCVNRRIADMQLMKSEVSV